MFIFIKSNRQLKVRTVVCCWSKIPKWLFNWHVLVTDAKVAKQSYNEIGNTASGEDAGLNWKSENEDFLAIPKEPSDVFPGIYLWEIVSFNWTLLDHIIWFSWWSFIDMFSVDFRFSTSSHHPWVTDFSSRWPVRGFFNNFNYCL